MSKQQVTNNSQRQVTFGSIEIRHYPHVLGYSPSCQDGGPALTLGWEPERITTTSVEEYEQGRPTYRRRTVPQLLLSWQTRVRRLAAWGYTVEDMWESMAENTDTIAQSRESRWSAIQREHRAIQITKKVQRAVRNLRKKQAPSNIYAGWRLPLSAHVF